MGAITKGMLKLLFHWRWLICSSRDSWCGCREPCEPAVRLQKKLWHTGSSVKQCFCARQSAQCLAMWRSREKFVFWSLTFSESVPSAGLSLSVRDVVQTDTCFARLLEEKNVFWRLCMSGEGVSIAAVSENGWEPQPCASDSGHGAADVLCAGRCWLGCS